jgi:hypothetical protein
VRLVPILIAVLVGCSGGTVPPAPTVTIAAPPTAPEPEATEALPAPVAKAPQRPKPAVSADGAVGVPECDEYLAKFATCLGKMPPQAQDAAKEALARMRQAWAQAAANPEGRTGLATGCRAALDVLTTNPACQ